MKSAKQLMEEMGFRKESSIEVQIAFMKNLIRQAYGVDVKDPNIQKLQKSLAELKKKDYEGEQLSLFDSEPTRNAS